MRFSMLFALSLVVATTAACSGPDPHQEAQLSSIAGHDPPPPTPQASHASDGGSATAGEAVPLTDEELDRMLDALEQEIDKK